MNYFMGEFAQKPVEKKDSELKRWGKVAGLGSIAGIGAYTPLDQYKNLPKLIKNSPIGAYQVASRGAIGALTAYGAYRGGKALINKLRNRKRKSNFSRHIEKNNNAEFQLNIAQGLKRFGNTRVGKVFLKDANVNKTYSQAGDLLKTTKGIRMSGKTLRKTPFAVAGLGLAGYGAYRANKTYNRYKPMIKIGRKVNDFLNRTGY